MKEGKDTHPYPSDDGNAFEKMNDVYLLKLQANIFKSIFCNLSSLSESSTPNGLQVLFWVMLGLIVVPMNICLAIQCGEDHQKRLKSISLEIQDLEKIKPLYETILVAFTKPELKSEHKPDDQIFNNSLQGSQQGNHGEYTALGINDALSLNAADSSPFDNQPKATTFLARFRQAISLKTKPAVQTGSEDNPGLNRPLL